MHGGSLRMIGVGAAGVAIALSGALASSSLGAAAAPQLPWLVPGTIITQRSSTAVISAATETLTPDPAGQLIDPATGQRYDVVYSAPPAGDGRSGTGVVTYSIVATDGDDVIVTRTLLLLDALSGRLLPSDEQSSRVAAADAVLIGRSPTALAGLANGPQPNGSLVLRGPWSLDGTSYDTVGISAGDASNLNTFYYDTDTGLLVFSSSRSVVQVGGSQPGHQELSLGTVELLGTRRSTVPGIGATVPAWLAARPTLVYRGQGSQQIPLQDPFLSDVERTVRVTDLGATFALFEVEQREALIPPAGLPAPSPVSLTLTSASGGSGPYWFDAAALASVTAGQRLDADPVTGATSTVSEVTATTVTITAEIPGSIGISRYDKASGVLLEYQSANETTGRSTYLALQR